MTHSVVICTRNRPDDLAACLASLGAQTRRPDEVVVVDASDDDRAERRARAWAAAGAVPAVRVLRAAPGLTRQRNVGVRAATGDVVTFVDDDVVLDPGYVAAILALFEADPGLGGAEGTVAHEPLRGRARLANAFRRAFLMDALGRRHRMQRSGIPLIGAWPATVELVDCLSGCNMSYRREVLAATAFDEWYAGYGLGEDADFSWRVARRWRLAQTPRARLVHRHSEVARERRPTFVEMSRVHHYYFVRKNMPSSWTTWACYLWSELGQLLALLKTGDTASIAACARGWRRVLGMRGAVRPAGAIREEATT
jgi:GT2 family glycosyltransferase